MRVTLNTGIGIVLTLGLFISIGTVQAAVSDQEVMNLADKLVELRGQVEALSNQLEQKKSEQREQFRSLSAQKAELEVQLSKEELRLKQIQQTIDTLTEKIENEQISKDYLKPLVFEQANILKNYINTVLPFKKADRLAEVDRIEQQLTNDEMMPEQALAQLWAMLEDEFRLTGESGLYKQAILLKGEEMIADVARLGMIVMFFQTNDGRVGKVVHDGSDWKYELITDQVSSEQVLYLFDSLKKRIREGFYELPNTLLVK